MARIQKLESDSSFQLSQILEDTVLTYKTYQNGRIIHKAKLADGNVVEINPQTDLSNYYTKSQVDQTTSALSDSIEAVRSSLNDYYTAYEIDQIVQSLSDSMEGIKQRSPKLIQFDSVSNNIYTINQKVAVFGVYTNQGQYYPIQKFSVQYQNNNTKLNVSAYLAYSNQAVFAGTWKALVAAI